MTGQTCSSNSCPSGTQGSCGNFNAPQLNAQGNYYSTFQVTIKWNGITSVCSYGPRFVSSSSTNNLPGSCSPAIPGVIPQYVDIFNTGGNTGLNVLGPGPGLSGTCP
ncbi:hypothetical protein [Rudaea sp.]|nr:hypothetical protein [Rudaea sp.]